MKSELKSENKEEVTQDILNFSLIIFCVRLLCATQGEGTHKGIKKEHKTILIKGLVRVVNYKYDPIHC